MGTNNVEDFKKGFLKNSQEDSLGRRFLVDLESHFHPRKLIMEPITRPYKISQDMIKQTRTCTIIMGLVDDIVLALYQWNQIRPNKWTSLSGWNTITHK